MKNTKKTRTKNSARENIDLFTKKNQKLTVGKEIILSNNDLKKKKQLIIKKSPIIGQKNFLKKTKVKKRRKIYF